MVDNRLSRGLDLVVVGAIAGAHGVKGEVRLRSFTAEPEDVFAYGPLLDEAGATVIDVKSYRPAKTHFVVTPTKTVDREVWEARKGARLHVPRSALPPADYGEFYIEDLLGLAAHTPAGERIGSIKAVQNFGADDLLEILPAGGGKSVFVPFTLADVPSVDLSGRVVTIADWPAWAADD